MLAAGIKMTEPIAIIKSPNAIPFLNPVFLRMTEDGIARKK